LLAGVQKLVNNTRRSDSTFSLIMHTLMTCKGTEHTMDILDSEPIDREAEA
jgi:hypothetical protein